MTVLITEAEGLEAAEDMSAERAKPSSAETSAGNPKTPQQRAKVTRGNTTKAPRQTKRAQLITLLKATTGKDIAALSDALGWQQHTTRAALSRLRSAGFEIFREVPKSGGAARYRITAEPSA